MGALLEIERVSRSFKGLQVLRDVSLAVEAGSITGLIGPNGAGKSTLFNIVSGFLEPQSGEVRFDGVSVIGRTVAARSRAGLVRTFQTPQVFANMTVRENLIAGCYKRTGAGLLANLIGSGRSRREIRELDATVDAWSERFGLGAFRDRLAGTLTAGQQRLVELARATVARPRLLCLDEPSSGLNTEEVNHLKAMLRGLNDDGVTLLVVSHDMDLVAVSGSIHVLCFGEIIARGSIAELKAAPRVREAYLGA